MKLIGLDPGERHCGFAVLERGAEGWVRGQIGVLEVAQDLYRAADYLHELIDERHDVTVISEAYHVRPVGHQKFTQALTVRLIGALQYISRINGVDFEQEPAGDPNTQIKLLGLSQLFETWSKEWPIRGDSRWNHGRAAWRVLARFMLHDHTKLLKSLHNIKVKQTHKSLSSEVRRPTDLWAPTALLRKP